MKNETLDALTLSANELVKALPQLATDGRGDLYCLEWVEDDKLAAVKASAQDIVEWTHAARKIAIELRDSLFAEPRRRAPAKANDG